MSLYIAVLLVLSAAWCNPPASAQDPPTPEEQPVEARTSVDELIDRIADLDKDLRSASIPAEERERLAREVDEAAALLEEEARDSEGWYRAGVFFYNSSRFSRLCALWKKRLLDIASQKDSWKTTLDLFYLSASRRMTQDWSGTLEVLEKLDETAARPGLEPEYRAASIRTATSERIRYLIEIGEMQAAIELLPKYEEAFRVWSGEPFLRIDLVVRLHRSNGDPRSVLSETTKYEELRGPLAPELRVLRDLSGLRIAQIERADLRPWIESLRTTVENETLPKREHIQADFDLFGFYLETGALEDARWCYEDIVRVLTAVRSDFHETGNRDEVLLTAFDAILALRSDVDRNTLEAKGSELDASFDRLMKWLASRPVTKIGSSIGYYDREATLFGSMIEVFTALHGDKGIEMAVDRIARYQSLSLLNQRLGAAPCTVADTREKLLVDETHGILMMQRIPSQTGGCRIIAWDRDRIRQAPIFGSIDSCRDWTQRLIEPLRASKLNLAAWQALSDQVTDQLLPPSIRELFESWDRVTLVGFDEELWFPFECLTLDGEYLGTQKDVDHLSALPLGVRLTERLATQASVDMERMLLVAAPDHSEAAQREQSHLEPIRFETEQIRRLTAAFPPEAVTVLQRKDATIESLREQEGPFAILHLFAHGIPASAANPEPGILLGSRDEASTGILRPRDVPEIPTAAVILSSCGVGRSLPRPMEGGLNNLAGEFLYRGARAVIFSHEPLLVGPTAELMALATDSIARGATPAAAMRGARAELVRRGVTDPRLHSTLRVWGLGHRPILPNQTASSTHKDLATQEPQRTFDLRLALTLFVALIVAVILVARRYRGR